MILTKLFKEVMMENTDYDYCDTADEYLCITIVKLLCFAFIPCVIILDIFLLPIELISIKIMKMKEKEKEEIKESKIKW